MNAFKALRDDCLDTEQAGSLRRPVTRTSGAVLLTRNDHERHAFLPDTASPRRRCSSARRQADES